MSNDQSIVPSEILSPKPKLALRQAVEDVFWEMGGASGMIAWVEESTVNRRIFYKDILPKLIPRELRGEITGADGGPMKMVIEWAGAAPPVEPSTAALTDVLTGIVRSNNEDD